MVRSSPSSPLARLRLVLRRWAASFERPAPEEDPAEPQVDPFEEFQSLQRGLRRLSLASDRSGQMLQALTVRLDEVQQVLIGLGRRPEVALALEETELLTLLDQLDRVVQLPSLPGTARSLVAGVTGTLLARAGWRAVAHVGSRPDGADLRIAEYIGESAASGSLDVRIHRVLEQGYRRADGTLLRPGVVTAAAVDADPRYTPT